MDIKEEIKERNESAKKIFEDSIDEVCSSCRDLIKRVKMLEDALECTSRVDNIGILLNNAYVKIYQMFKKKNIPMFVGTYNIPFSSEKQITLRVVTRAIMKDLFSLSNEGMTKLADFALEENKALKRIFNVVLSLEEANAIERFIFQLKCSRNNENPFYITEEEKANIENRLTEYQKKANEVWKYDVEERLVPALVEEIAYTNNSNDSKNLDKLTSAFIIPDIVSIYIEPDLKALGFEHLIPEVKKALIKEYEKNIPDYINQSEKDLYLPHFDDTDECENKNDSNKVYTLSKENKH